MQNIVTLSLPDWLPEFLEQYPTHLPHLEDRMRLVLAVTRANIQATSGGPFGAAVFEKESGRIVSVGVNRVVSQQVSSAHAEVLALTFAQKKLGVHDLGGAGLPAHQLVVNAQMCAMCLGAVCWSGIKDVVYACTSQDVERITGFDEGPLPADIASALTSRGITVTEGMLAEEGIGVLQLYVQAGGMIYNARQGD